MRKLILANNLLFPFLSILTLSFLVIESFTYQGFLAKFLFIDAKAFLFILVVMGIFIIVGYGSQFKEIEYMNPILQLVFNFSYLLSPVLLVVYYIMVSIESINYPNYVFSTFHINPDNFTYVVFLSFYLSAIGTILKLSFSGNHIKNNKGLNGGIYVLQKSDKKLTHKIIFFTKVINLYVIFCGIFFIFDGLVISLRESIKSNIFIIRHLNYSYDEKMFETWHFLYKYLSFVKTVTPSNAAIAIPPPIRPWLSEGNSVLVRYFLYPRYLVTPENELPETVVPQYYLLTKGSWKAYEDSDYGWPRQDLDSELIYYFDPVSFQYSAEESNYIFNDQNRYAWGVIKLKNNL